MEQSLFMAGDWYKRREMFFWVKILLFQPLKSPKKIYPTPNISIKKQIPTPGQKLYKRIPFSCHTCPLSLL
jgi:hypothetical protein